MASEAQGGDSMTEKEAIKLLALIKVAYPTAYRDMDDASKRATVAMWYQTFASVPYPIMEMAFDHFRRVSKFPPTVADMFDALKEVYNAAVGELFETLQFSKDPEAIRRYEYIMKHTERFKADHISHRLNIGKISSNLLPGGDENGLSTL